MTPAALRARLDRSLADRGEDAVLRRRGDDGFIELLVRCFARGYEPAELVGGIQQGDTKVTLSGSPFLAPTDTWPGDPDSSLLPQQNDLIRTARGNQNVQSVDPIYQGAELIRLNVRVRG